MATLIKNRRLLEETCRHLDIDEPLPETGAVTVPLARWLRERAVLCARADRVGVRLGSSDALGELAPDLPHLDLIALEFTRFTDGRGYSQARLLRERWRYRGELRAVGEVLRDQLFFMARCGIDAFELAPGQDPTAALAAFNEITVHYQPAADTRRSVPRQRAPGEWPPSVRGDGYGYPLPIAAG